MSRKYLFIGLTLVLLVTMVVSFYLTARHQVKKGDSLEFSASDENTFLNGMNNLDSLYNELEKAVYKRDVNATAQINVLWERSKDDFLAKHQKNQMALQMANEVLENFRNRIKMMKDSYKVKSASVMKANEINEAIQIEKTKNEQLKTDNVLIKEALLKL
ncbi:MAG: hypothetical protein ABIN80_13725 [Dyadobacter sp.]|uniref:hypothetical protein n=1 Tax=Dyadobacter sp. TaxID=1914288 RepID=UPI003264D767